MTRKYSRFITYDKEGKWQSLNDKPAVIRSVRSGVTKIWYKDGWLHRDNDKPDMVAYKDGTKSWYKKGKLHRDNDKPAITCKDGTKYWYKEGLLHRDNDNPAVINKDGTKYWYKNGKFFKESL